jgi:hypothetical protein
MSLPWAAHGLKFPYVVRNDWQSRGLAMAAVAHTHGRHCLGAIRTAVAYLMPDHHAISQEDTPAPELPVALHMPGKVADQR